MPDDTGERRIEAPTLTWKPTKMNVGVSVSVGVVAAVASLPLWLSAPATALLISLAVPACTLFVGIWSKRQFAVRIAYISSRGGATPDQNAAIAGARGGDIPPFMPLLCLVFALGIVPLWFLPEASRRVAVGELVFMQFMLATMGLMFWGIGWSVSPWFRVRWFLLAATASRESRRGDWMALARAHDPERPHVEQVLQPDESTSVHHNGQD